MKSKVNKNIALVGILTAVSRSLGFLRDAVIAWLIGAGPIADAFFVAFRIPNLLRRLLAEGATNVAFVPVFNETMEKEGLDRAFSMARKTITLMVLTLGAIVIIGEITSPFIVTIIAPGFIDTNTFDIALHLTRIMFPYILLVSIVAMFMGILNSLDHFAAPAAAPILLNISMICIPIFFYILMPFFGTAEDALAWSVILGGLLQIGLQISPLRTRNVPLRPSFNFKDKRVKQVLKLIGIAAIGASVYQINVLIGTILASFLPRGSVSYLYYANRLVELPLGIFAFAVGNVMLPVMSQASARVKMKEMSGLVGKATNTILFFTVPSSLGLFVLAEPIVSLLFVRGQFRQIDALLTAQALRMYALGLWAIGISRILTQALYAMQQATTAVKVAWVTLVINLVLSIILMPYMQHVGLALATTLSVIIQVALLHYLLRKRGVIIPTSSYASLVKISASGIIMFICLIPVVHIHFWMNGLTPLSLLLLGMAITGGAVIYFISAWLMGIRSTH